MPCLRGQITQRLFRQAIATESVNCWGYRAQAMYYRPVPVSEADLAIMRRLDKLHLLYPFFGEREEPRWGDCLSASLLASVTKLIQPKIESALNGIAKPGCSLDGSSGAPMQWYDWGSVVQAVACYSVIESAA